MAIVVEARGGRLYANDKAWEESAHPRGPDGKFISGSGEGGAVTPKDVAEAYGMTNVTTSSSGTTIGVHAGEEFIMHKDGSWESATKPGVQGSSQAELTKYLKTGEKPGDGPADASELEEAAEKHDLVLADVDESLNTYAVGSTGMTVQHDTDTGYWSIHDPAGEVLKSKDQADADTTLSKALSEMEEGHASSSNEQAATTAVIDATGAEPAGTGANGEQFYDLPGEKELQVDKDGSWKISDVGSSGELVAEGDDADSLKKHLNQGDAPDGQLEVVNAVSEGGDGAYGLTKMADGDNPVSTWTSDTDGSKVHFNVKTGGWAYSDANNNGVMTGKGTESLKQHLATKASEKTAQSLQSMVNAPPPMTEKQQSYIVNSHVGKIIKEHGFKKIASADGTLKFKHADGAEIVVHPPAPDKKSSSKWTVTGAAGEKKGEGISIGKAIQALGGQKLGNTELPKAKPLGDITHLAGQGEAPKPTVTAPTKIGTASFKKMLEPLGDASTKASKAHPGYLMAAKLPTAVYAQAKGIYYSPTTGDWFFKDNLAKSAKPTASGSGNQSFAEALQGVISGSGLPQPSAPQAQPQQAAQPAPSSPGAVHKSLEPYVDKATGTADVHSFLQSKGYGSSAKISPPGEEVVFAFVKPNGDKVEMKPGTGEWLAVSAGHMTKMGNGASDLAHLLSGEPAVVKGKALWSNVSTKSFVVSPEEKAQLEAAKKQQVAAGELTSAMPEATKKEMSAVKKYTSNAYAAWNDKLRHNPGFSDESTKELDAYLAKSELPMDMVLSRKVSGEYAKILKSVIMEGTKFIDHGYVSTSTSTGVWSGSLQMHISVKKGQRGVYVDSVSTYKGEKEVLLPRGSAFVVTKFDRTNSVVHVELDQSHFKEGGAYHGMT